jgi:hypothetical protein
MRMAKTRMAFDALVGRQRLGESGGQIGSFEMKALRHEVEANQSRNRAE